MQKDHQTLFLEVFEALKQGLREGTVAFNRPAVRDFLRQQFAEREIPPDRWGGYVASALGRRLARTKFALAAVLPAPGYPGEPTILHLGADQTYIFVAPDDKLLLATAITPTGSPVGTVVVGSRLRVGPA